MEEVKQTDLATLPALSRAVAEWFPFLDGRSLPVAESEVSKENQPTLPLVQLALLRETAAHSVKTGRMEITEDIVVEFWLKPERYKTASGGETPFWSFYNYDALRDQFMTNMLQWRTPRGERLEYVELSIEADRFATILTFRLRHTFVFCPLTPECDPCNPDIEGDGRPFVISTTICAPDSLYCEDPSADDDEKEDPCHPSYT